MDQDGTSSETCPVRRSSRVSASAIARRYSASTRWWAGCAKDGQLAEPARVRPGPGAAAGEDPAVAEQEGLQLLARAPQLLHRRLAGAHQLAHGLVAGIRDPDRRELAGAVQLGQGQRVPPVGLDPLARALRDQR